MTKTKNITTLSTRRTSQYVRRVAVFSHRFDTQSVLEEVRQMNTRKKRLFKKVVSWWQHQDSKHRLGWRTTNVVVAFVLLVSIVTPYVGDIFPNKRYRLSQDTIGLVGKNNQALSGKLKFNAQTQTYEFNKDAIKEYNPVDALQQQVGGAGDKTKSLYALDVPADPKKGVTYHDVNSKLSFKLVPQFNSLPAKAEQGRIIFPLDSGPQAVYTLKNNGLKEDIVVTNNKQDSLSFSYKLELPKSLEARQLPDGSGGIGIYSGDPTLFTNMSYGSDRDRELVDKAREKAEKTNLVFGIPAPVITTNGERGSANARFELHNNQLAVVASHLADIKGTFSIDPSVLVTSTSDFATGGNDEGNIDFGTDRVNRGSLTGGTIGSWAGAANTGTTLFPATGFAGTAAYNGYLYGVAGSLTGGVGTNNVYYALICTGPSSNTPLGCDSNATAGKLGNWVAATTLAGNQLDVTNIVVYNGFIYVLGGGNATNASFQNTYYAQICTGSNSGVNGCSSTAGSLGTWNAGSNLFQATAVAQSAVYNGYVYLLGGCSGTWINCNSTVRITTIQYAQLRADGSLGTWSNNGGNALPIGRHRGAAVAYNGRIYIMGGCTQNLFSTCTSNSIRATDTQYTTINADGSLGTTWTTSPNAFASPSLETEAAVYKGYIYYFTYTGIGGGNTHITQYAQVQADGSIAPIKSTSLYSGTSREYSGTLITNGYMYIIGGCTAASCNATTNDVQVAKIDTPGVTAAYGTAANYEPTNGRTGFSTVSYGGFIYAIGGTVSNAGATVNMLNTTRYAQINADGTLGTWATASATFNNVTSVGGDFCSGASSCPGRVEFAAKAYNGYVYMAGGWTNASGTARTFWSDVQSAVVCTGVNTPVTGCAAAGDLRGTGGAATWTTQLADFVTNSTTVYNDADGRSKISMEIYNGNIYLIGGRNDGGNPGGASVSYATVYYAPLAAGGGVGTFATTTNLPSNVGRAEPKTFVANNRLYLVGGDNTAGGNEWGFQTNDADDVWFIPIKSDGTLDGTVGWKDANNATNGGSGSSFASANGLMDYNVNFSNGYVYITGGQNGAGASATYATVYKAQVNISNGSLGGWTTTTSFSTQRYDHGTVITNGNLYVIGGCSSRSTLGTLNCNGTAQMLITYQNAQINNGGGEYAQAGANKGSFTTARSQTAAVAYNGYIYLTGGCSTATGIAGCTVSTNDTRYASIAVDGTLTWGTLTTAGNVPTARYGHAMAAYNGYLYVMGGCSSTGGTNGFCTAFLNDVQRVKLNSDGNTTGNSWASAGTTLATARYGLSAASYNGYLYVIGGCSATTSGNCSTFKDTVEYAQVNVDGSLGSWTVTGGTFATGRFLQNVVAYAGNLYVMAGCSAMSSGNCTTFKDDVQYATINTDGTVSSTWNASTSISIARYGAALTARNGTLYLSGGCSANSSGSCSTYQSDTQAAQVYTGGSTGEWSVRFGSYTDPRYTHASVITNGYFYILGGMKTGSALLADSQGAALQLQPRIGRYSKIVDLGADNARVNSIMYNGSLADSFGNISYKTATSTNLTFSASSIAPNTPDLVCSLTVVKARYVFVMITFDDMAGGATGGTFGEAPTDVAGVTDFSVNYNYVRPAPNIRLRHGQTLQKGDLSPFDTCPLGV